MKKFLLLLGVLENGLPTLSPRTMTVIKDGNGMPVLEYDVILWPTDELGAPLRASQTMARYHYSSQFNQVSLIQTLWRVNMI